MTRRRELWAEVSLIILVIWAGIGVFLVVDMVMSIPTHNNREARVFDPKSARDYGSIEKVCIRYLRRLNLDRELKEGKHNVK